MTWSALANRGLPSTVQKRKVFKLNKASWCFGSVKTKQLNKALTDCWMLTWLNRPRQIVEQTFQLRIWQSHAKWEEPSRNDCCRMCFCISSCVSQFIQLGTVVDAVALNLAWMIAMKQESARANVFVAVANNALNVGVVSVQNGVAIAAPACEWGASGRWVLSGPRMLSIDWQSYTNRH